MLVGFRKGTLRAPTRQTLRDAAEELTSGMESGLVRTRSGDPYKPSVTRGYKAHLAQRITPELGHVRLADIQRRDIQQLVDRWLSNGASPATVRNALMPLRVIFRRAIQDGDLEVNPTSHLRVPAARGRRDRIASPKEAAQLIAALPTEHDRALWSTAFYAGLRLGELVALKWDDVDLAAGLIRVQHSWDPKEGELTPKSRAGERTVPVPAVLRDVLVEHRLSRGARSPFVFGEPNRLTLLQSATRKAKKIWVDAGANPIGLHEARHTYASLMIAAGVNAKALTVYMGHSSVTVTYDRYGHLMPGNEDEAAALLDSYLEAAGEVARSLDVDAFVNPREVQIGDLKPKVESSSPERR